VRRQPHGFGVPHTCPSHIYLHPHCCSFFSHLQVALQALKERVGSKPVHCEVKNKDQYGRNVAACSILDGRVSEDMGSWLVSNGHAVAYK
jgi:hypothetical protein